MVRFGLFRLKRYGLFELSVSEERERGLERNQENARFPYRITLLDSPLPLRVPSSWRLHTEKTLTD